MTLDEKFLLTKNLLANSGLSKNQLTKVTDVLKNVYLTPDPDYISKNATISNLLDKYATEITKTYQQYSDNSSICEQFVKFVFNKILEASNKGVK